MEIIIMVMWRMVYEMVKVYSSGRVRSLRDRSSRSIMMESGVMILCMDMGSTNGLMVGIMLGCGSRIRWMVRVCSGGLMVSFIKDHISRIGNMG